MLDKLNDVVYFLIVIGGSFVLGVIAGTGINLYPSIEKLSWEAIIGFSSLFIAVLAFVHTIIQGYEANKFNKSTVRPQLTTWTHSDYNNMSFDVFIRNNGIGPALIMKFKYLVDDIPIEGKRAEVVKNLLLKLFPDYQYTFTSAYVGPYYVMRAGEEVKLFNIIFDHEKKPTKEIVDAAADKVDIIINYESVYGEKLDMNTKKMIQMTNLF